MGKTDALLVWGGDSLYLNYWMRQSGLTDLLRSLRREVVYVGVSAGTGGTVEVVSAGRLKPFTP